MAGADQHRPGALVVSLDFELAWGVRERAAEGYAANLHGSRIVIPRLLALFEEYGIAATWATVGFLFARSREELVAASPSIEVRPVYEDGNLDAYAEVVGRDEDDDPLHYAPSLIERIQRTPRQEIATHTFSHYYCAVAGQNAETFRADLSAARAIADRRGIELTSIVFPRNQHNPAYDPILLGLGVRAYRGRPHTWMWRPARREARVPLRRRAARLLDSYVNLSGHGAYRWSEVLQPSGLSDVRASCFLRPVSPSGRSRTSLQLRRIRQSLRITARRGEIYHLWWHPHNFGLHVDENLAMLRTLLDEFARLREAWGMTTLTMREVDQVARGAESIERVSTPIPHPIF